jgi:hypothetical protein
LGTDDYALVPAILLRVFSRPACHRPNDKLL